MKNLKMALALLAIVALASPSFAAIELSVTQLADPAQGLTAWMVSATGTGGDLVNTVSYMDVTVGEDRTGGAGSVHNVLGFSMTGTAYESECTGVFWDPAWTALDSHAVFGSEDLILSLGDSLAETNDGSDPAGLALAGPAAFPTFVPTVGMGTLGQAWDSTIAFEGTTSFDLAQIVLPVGSSVYFNAELIGGGGAIQCSELIGVPEPSTIIMLVLARCAWPAIVFVNKLTSDPGKLASRPTS